MINRLRLLVPKPPVPARTRWRIPLPAMRRGGADLDEMGYLGCGYVTPIRKIFSADRGEAHAERGLGADASRLVTGSGPRGAATRRLFVDHGTLRYAGSVQPRRPRGRRAASHPRLSRRLPSFKRSAPGEPARGDTPICGGSVTSSTVHRRAVEADVEGRFTYVSARAERLLGIRSSGGWPRGSCRGYSRRRHLRVMQALSLTAESGDDTTWPSARPGRTERSCISAPSCRSRPLDGASCIQGVLADVSAAHRADEERSSLLLRAEKAAAEAQAANRAKDEFVAMLSTSCARLWARS